MFIQSIKKSGHIHSSQFTQMYADTSQFQLVALIMYMQTRGYGLVRDGAPVFRKAVDKMEPGERGRRDVSFNKAVSIHNNDESNEHKIFKDIKLSYDKNTGDIHCPDVRVRFLPNDHDVEVVELPEELLPENISEKVE